METTVRLYSPTYRESRTYLMAALFIAGNIILPQLCHTIPQGGLIFLPIYFFTLISACKYGWQVGLLTALLSPMVNHLMFGMPPAHALLPITVKSVALAFSASLIGRRHGTVTLFSVAAAVVAYQFVGSIFEWVVTGSPATAIQDMSLGLPGIMIQIFGGYGVLRWLLRR